MEVMARQQVALIEVMALDLNLLLINLLFQQLKVETAYLDQLRRLVVDLEQVLIMHTFLILVLVELVVLAEDVLDILMEEKDM
jgi:hypothetical protein